METESVPNSPVTEYSGSESSEHRGTFADWSMKATKAAIGNPAISIPVGTLVLFLVARIPAQIFYDRLGITPDAVGLDSVQVLLQGSAAVLLLGLVIGLVYGAVFPALNAAYWATFRPFVEEILENLDPNSRPQRWAARLVGLLVTPGKTLKEELIDVARRAPIIVPVITVAVAGVILTGEAFDASTALRNGQEPGFKLSPWTGRRVNATWTSNEPHKDLPNCEDLFYLGENDGHIVLFDSSAHATDQISTDRIELSFPQRCG